MDFLSCLKLNYSETLWMTFTSTQYTMLKNYVLESIICLCFNDVNKWHQFLYILKETVKVYQYGYQMKGLNLSVKNLLLVDRFCCFLMRNW